MSASTANEQRGLSEITGRLELLRDYLNSIDLEKAETLSVLFSFLTRIKDIQGNSSNDVSFVACLLAKQYLLARHHIDDFDVATKPQGAPGLDIDVLTVDRRRIVGEIKTTVPYSAANAKGDLGSNQKVNFRKDFAKLNRIPADYKYFFLTDTQTFRIVEQKYANELSGVNIVLLYPLPGLAQSIQVGGN